MIPWQKASKRYKKTKKVENIYINFDIVVETPCYLALKKYIFVKDRKNEINSGYMSWKEFKKNIQIFIKKSFWLIVR